MAFDPIGLLSFWAYLWPFKTVSILSQHIRIGTRGSALALWQAHYVADLLTGGGLAPEIITFETKGDKILDKSLAKIGSKGVFTAELEHALRAGEVDIAVHSAKDLQSELPEDLEILAFTEREEVNDVLVSLNHSLSITDGKPWVIGTSSTRRTATLRHYYPHLQRVDMRGNLQTRMRKMQEGQCDALLLAFAGVHRMGYDEHIVARLSIEQFTPPVGQGSVAVESARSLNDDKRHLIRDLINHPRTEYCLLAERGYLRRLQGGCSVPVFALATLLDEGTVQLTGGVVSLDGSRIIRETMQAPADEATQLGYRLADAVIDAGGYEILKEIRQNLSAL
ncbi:MAG: Porphobilinogen deaminase [uncultured Cytophagales bacterium]|uniref:Porphobilinogen deaminase n=1 Tax=uncultured Cytophagales bacterium TaxID=158755 RepID=A0A6J4IJV7_9SPHI|nr:MAG: Porphobilinogen deaminase [uncultured Cytophagales bacterium]